MTNLESPAVARYRVRVALRAAREAKQLTQGQVAKAMQWSLSKVIRIEKGEVNVSANDLRVLLDHLDVRDPKQVNQLLDDARLSRQERWQIDPADREHMTPAMIEAHQYENVATTMRAYAVIVPGILQTREYATALFMNASSGLSKDTVTARIDARLARRERILYQKQPPTYLALLDESALQRSFCGAAILADQLDYIARTARDTPLLVRVLPFTAPDVVMVNAGSFNLYDLDKGESALLYRERLGKDETNFTEPEVTGHREAFDRMWAVSLDEEASIALIEEKAAFWRRVVEENG